MTDSYRTPGGYLIAPLKLRRGSEHKTEAYHYVCGEDGWMTGWVTFLICDELGELSVQSDWGCWGHRWDTRALGPAHDGSLTHFLATASPWYITNKLSYSMDVDKRQVPDTVTTEKRMKEAVLLERRKLRMEAEDARELWEEIEQLMPEFHSGGMNVAYPSMSKKLGELLEDGWEWFEHEENPNLVILRERLIPFLQDTLKRKINGPEQQREAQGQEEEKRSPA